MFVPSVDEEAHDESGKCKRKENSVFDRGTLHLDSRHEDEILCAVKTVRLRDSDESDGVSSAGGVGRRGMDSDPVVAVWCCERKTDGVLCGANEGVTALFTAGDNTKADDVPDCSCESTEKAVPGVDTDCSSERCWAERWTHLEDSGGRRQV